MYNEVVRTKPDSLEFVPDQYKTQEMYNETVGWYPYLFLYVPDQCKTYDMCYWVVCMESSALDHVLDQFKTQEMCDEIMRIRPGAFFLIPDHFKTKEMLLKQSRKTHGSWSISPILLRCKICNKAVWKGPSSLHYVPDWFVTQQQIKIWHDNDDYSDDDRLIKWSEYYQKCKTHKMQIETESMRIASHPSRWGHWCLDEDKKKEIEKLWA